MILLPCSIIVLLCSMAHARAVSATPYTVAEAFSSAVRFVRIDRGCKVTDKDADAAFVTFECKDDDQTKRGSIEIIKQANGVRLQVTLGDDPHYVELRLLELLERKLREEHGTPVAAPPKKSPPVDAGAT
jgi:hypothetical protein